MLYTPTYWSTGNHLFTFSFSNGFVKHFEDGYLKKYHDEHIKVSIVSVSLLAKLPHLGHVVFIQLWLLPRELILLEEILISFGSFTGILSLFTGTEPQLLHLIIGIGHPQYLCLEINQSLKRYWILFSAHPFFPHILKFVLWLHYYLIH